MKIVCEKCGAKYSIADEKVAGKVFKIRCKKCSEVIVVRGDQEAATGAPATAQIPGEEIWHVVVNGEQHGPVTAQRVGELLSLGEIDWETYVWREGFDEWKPAKDVDDLVSVITASPITGSSEVISAGSASADALADLASSSLAPEAAPSRPSRVEADLFAQAEPAPASAAPSRDEDEDVVASAPSPRISSEKALTGQRSENSVLFSMQNLQALAGGAGSVAPAPKPGMATAEGSGLIDIRALASAASTGASGAKPSGGSGKDAVDDLLAIGSGPSPFGPSLGAPALAPVAVQKESGSKTGLIVGVVGIVAAIAAAAVAVVVVTGRENTPATQVTSPEPSETGSTPAPRVAEPTAPAESPQAATPAPTETAEATAEGTSSAETGAPASEEETREEPARSGRDHDRDHRSDARPHTEAAAATPTPTPSQPANAPAQAGGRETGGSRQTGGGGSIDDLLDRALGPGGNTATKRPAEREARPAPAADENLPQTPSRDQVLSAMRGVTGAVTACGEGQHGVATATVTVASSGRVSNVSVGGQFAGSPIGSCVARAVRGASFPRFQQSTFRFDYPFRL